MKTLVLNSFTQLDGDASIDHTSPSLFFAHTWKCRTAIIRRRIVTVIGEWAMKLPRELRPSVYQVIMSLLSRNDKESHIAVRLAAANTLRICTH